MLRRPVESAGDIGAYGSEIQTPNIDKLAREGVHFTNFCVGVTCSPTRTVMISGVDNHHTGLGNMLGIMADNQFGKPGLAGLQMTTLQQEPDARQPILRLSHGKAVLDAFIGPSKHHGLPFGQCHLA